MRVLVVIFSLICNLCLVVPATHAQTADLSIEFSVKDSLGGAIPDAVISIEGAGGSGKRFSKQFDTDKRGAAKLNRVAAGQYVLTVNAAGFKEHKDEAFTVRESLTVDIVLEIAPIESNVEVGENEAVEAERTGGTVIDEKTLEKMPNDQESFERALRALGESITGEQSLPVTVNGVEGQKIPPKESIQQIRVNQNVFSAQYDGPWGGGIEIFTRQSADRFRTSIGTSFAHSRLNAADPFIGQRIPFRMNNIFGSLSGPFINKKKANFSIFGSITDSSSSSVINAIILNDQLLPVAFRESVPTPTRSENLWSNINADPTPKHKLYFSYNYNGSRATNQISNGFSLPSRANDSRSMYQAATISDTFLMNPNVVIQTRLSATYDKSRAIGISDESAINVLDSFASGGSQQNSSTSNFRVDASNDTTWQMGRYALGFGVRVRAHRLDQNSANDFGGTYTFAGRLAPELDANNQPIPGSEIEIGSLETYRRTLLFRGLGYTPQQIRQLGGGANQFTIAGGDPEIGVSQYEIGVYMQNSYKLSETLAASFGLRYENQTNISSEANFAPRFGLIWAPKSKDKQNPLTILPRVSIGYGLFYQRFPISNIVTVRQAADSGRQQYLITDPDVLDLFPSVPTIENLEGFALPQTQRLINDDLQTPFNSLLNVTVTKRMPKGFGLNFVFQKGWNVRQTVTRNINAPLAGTYDPQDPSSTVRPFGDVGNIYEINSTARAESERYSLNLNFPQSQKLFASLRYSYGKSRGNTVTSTGSPFDAYDFSQEFGPSSFDGVHSGGGYMYLTLPKKFNLGGDLMLSTGSRFNIFTGRDTNGDGFFSERPSFATDRNKPGVIDTPYGLLDPNPSPGDKLIPRNIGRGASSVIVNASLGKTFGFNEDKAKKTPPRQSLNFSIRVNNIFNFVSKGSPIGNMASPNFLRTLSRFNDGSIFIMNGVEQNMYGGRNMSLGATFSF